MKNKILNLMMAGVLIAIPLYPVGTVKCHKTFSVWMQKNFTYQAEKIGIDRWKTPTKTRLDKGGDCEDFAFYNQAVLQKLGYIDLKVIHVFGLKSWFHGKKEGDKKIYSHAICIFKKDGKWNYFDNQYFIPHKRFTNIEDLVRNVCPKWKWWREIQLPHISKGKHYRKVIVKP